MGDENENERLGPPWVLDVDDPLPSAILPEGRPGGIVAVVAGMSMRDAKRIVAIANALLSQRDEARALVRGALKWQAGGSVRNQFKAAIARWDEEEAKR